MMNVTQHSQLTHLQVIVFENEKEKEYVGSMRGG